MTKRPHRPAATRALRPAPPPAGHRHAAFSTGALTVLAALFLTACISRPRFALAPLERAQPPAMTAQALRHLVDDGVPGAAPLTTRDASPPGVPATGHGDRSDLAG